MKKLLLTTVIASLFILPFGPVALADDVSATEPSVEYVEYIPGAAPALSSSVDAMTPALHAVLLAMENQQAESFTTEDPVLAWEMLYNLLSMYGQLDERSSYEEDVLILPSETVYDYAAALFPEMPDPAQLPEALADRMTYDAQNDEFRLICGSDGLSEVVISTTVPSGKDLLVAGSLVYLAEDTQLAAFTATLSAADNLFGCVISDLSVA